MNSLVEASQVCSYEETGYINSIYNWLNQEVGLIDYEYKFINGEYVSEPPKYYQTYGDKKWNGGYNFAEGNANSQGYEGLLYLREFGRDPDDQVVTVTGSDGKDIYAPRQDIYVRETNDVTCSGEPMNKSPDAFYDYHFKITRLSREDVILLPFTSETDVFYDSDTRILYRKTPENRIDKLVEFVEDLPKKTIKKSLGFLDTMELDEIINAFSGVLKGSKKPNLEAGKITLWKPDKFDKRSIDRITNFKPSNDALDIVADSFGIDSSATFAAGKNMKVLMKLAKQDFDFLYDKKKGGLYFNENGSDKGFGQGGIIAILKGAPDLTSGNLEFI